MQNDPRVGGTYRVVDRRNGQEFVAGGEYLEINRPRRMVFTFRMAQFSDSVDRVVVEIAPLANGCRLTLTQEIVMPHAWLQAVMGKTDPLTPQEIEMGLTHLARETEQGWCRMLESLARALGDTAS